MDNVIVVPDVHCRDFYKPILNIEDKRIVFLGDYMDPYPNEPFTAEMGIANLKEILDFKKANPERVSLLWGNHDMNYLWCENWASRYNRFIAAEVHNIFKENFNLFEPFKVIDDVLFIHAGISNGWCWVHKIEDPIVAIGEYWKEFVKDSFHESVLPFFDCGYARGGYNQYGGPLWNDLSEYAVKNPVDYVQIAGHNQLRETGKAIKISDYTSIEGKPIYCCDARAIFEWNGKELNKYD